MKLGTRKGSTESLKGCYSEIVTQSSHSPRVGFSIAVIRCNRNLLVDIQAGDLLLSAPAVTEQDSCVLGTENAVCRTIHVYI